MSLADAIVHTVVDATDHVCQKILGRTFHIEPKRAQNISGLFC